MGDMKKTKAELVADLEQERKDARAIAHELSRVVGDNKTLATQLRERSDQLTEVGNRASELTKRIDTIAADQESMSNRWSNLTTQMKTNHRRHVDKLQGGILLALAVGVVVGFLVAGVAP